MRMGRTTLIRNAVIVTVDDSNTVYDRGYVYVEDGKITDVGEGDTKDDADMVLDLPGRIVMPGIVVAHTHLYGILLRGAALRIAPPTDFAQVLQRIWWPVDEALTVDDAYASALSAGAEMLLSGCTTFADTYSGPNAIEGCLEAIARATDELGMRGIIAFEVTERHSPEEAERGLDETQHAARTLSSDDKISLMVSVHASFTVSDGLITKAVRRARTLDLPLTIHTSEGLVDLYHNLEKYGERTIERLDRLGAVTSSTVLAHCVHVNDTELDIVAERGASVAHNPMSNMLNAVGVAPVPKMLNRGITVGLGNDGWIFDPFENMRCALTVHRLAAGDPSVVDENTVLRMATVEAARCYGLEGRVGSIRVSNDADVIVIDGRGLPTPVTSRSVIGHIVHSVRGSDVEHVLVGGELVVRDHALVRVDRSRVSEISRRAARALWDRLH